MFESPKVNRDLTSSIINFLYEFCCELPNSIGLRVLKEYEIFGKCQNCVDTEPRAESPFQKQNFGHSSNKFDSSRYQFYLALFKFA